MLKGINMGSTDLDLITAILYTRVREDRKNRVGSSPTKLKIPISQLNYLPQIHPATDIPYSYALSIVSNFIGRNVLIEHNDLKRAGHILFSALTENPEYTLPKSNKEECMYEGKPLKFLSIIGVLGIEKKKKKYFDNFHIGGYKDLDCSIGYSYYFDLDEIVYCKNGDVDWNKTLVFATGFTEREVSLCDHGNGACPGANVISQLSKRQLNNNIKVKFGMSIKLWKLFTKRSQKLCKSTINNKIMNNKLLNVRGFFRKFKIKRNKSLNIILQKNKILIQERINIILKKKKMSKDEEQVDLMNVDSGSIPNGDKELNTPQNGDTEPKSNDELDYGKMAQDLGFSLTPNFFGELGKDMIHNQHVHLQKYKDKALKTFPEKRDKFKKVVKTLNKEEMLNERVEDDLKEMYSNPDKEPISKIFQLLINSFDEIHSKNNLGKGEPRKEPMLPQPTFSKDDKIFYSELSKKQPVKKTLAKKEHTYNVKPSTVIDKSRYSQMLYQFKNKGKH